MGNEYLDRPLIDEVVFEITETRVSIQCPSTIFVRCVLPERCNKKAMLRLYRRVLQLAKARKVKISYSLHIHKTIREQWDAYIAAREEQEQIFQQLRESATTVQQRGIHLGYCDDTELDKAIKYSWRVAEIARKSNAAWQITSFTHRLLETEQYLADHGKHGDMIAL